MGDIFRKFVNILNESFMNFNEFFDEFNEFVDEIS